MADPKKYFQLVNFAGQKPLDIVFGESNSDQDQWYYCDWDLDGNGGIRTIRKEDAIAQTTLKCVFTEKQNNGYGTNIFDMIGQKDVLVSKTSLFIDISMAVMAMKLFADAQAEKQDIPDEDLVRTVSKLVVTEDETHPTWITISMALVTNSGANVRVNVI